MQAPLRNPFDQALLLFRAGKFEQSAALLDQIISADAGHAEALHLSGILCQQKGEHARAVRLISQALAVDPSRAAPHSNLGIALHRLGRLEDALASFDRALAINPGHVQALVNRGNTLLALARPALAVSSYQAALALKADSPEAWVNLGNAQMEIRQADAALESYRRALELRPGYAQAHVYCGNALREMHRDAQALGSFEQALALAPDHVGALIGRGNALQRLKRHAEALASYDRALQLEPERLEVLNNRGSALRDLKRYPEAADSFARLAVHRPDFDYVHSNALHSRLYCCDWKDYAASVQRVCSQVGQGKCADVPFSFVAISGSAAEQLDCARDYVARRFPSAPEPLWPGPRAVHERIRVAYLSADFHEHATAYLMAGLFERHDRTRFHVTAISFGPRAEDAMRQRLVAAFDQFIDVRDHSDAEAARLIRELEIDIVVDLKGFTADNRAGILAWRPAPVQVSYLGFPGTMGAPYMDYLIADPVLVANEDFTHYSEQLLRMPHSYQVNDDQRMISPETPTRAEAGLPERGFVFCCFNNNYKIAPSVFGAWMRLLKKVPGSVLWLLADNPDAARNLRAEAHLHLIAPDRLVFATRVPLPEHLARHRLADLFLDTLPYNAHTTASDALWAGLPLLTCAGQTFAGRVAASLLSALGLQELITHNLDEYETLALRLATTPDLLQGVREKLEANRLRFPLFDTDLFRRQLEAAYLHIWERHLAGEAPAHFDVPAQA